MNMNEPQLFAGDQNQLAVFTPIDSLLSAYRKDREDLERIASYVAGETRVMHYFMAGAQIENQISSISAASLFELAPAVRELDASYWSRAMSLTDVLDSMPAAKRNEWNEQIRGHKTPAFEPESVKATIGALLAQRSQFFAERVDGLFRALSGEHLTNAPEGFGKRMIIAHLRSHYDTLNYDRSNYIHDLRCVIAKFMGRDAPFANVTHDDLNSMYRNRQYGEWKCFDGGAFRVRLYMKGTAHLEVHPDIAYRLNQVLAWLHPMAIPNEFRTKPAKAPKDFTMVHDLVPFEVLSELARGRVDRTGKSISFFYNSIKPNHRTVQVLQYLGGVPGTMGNWSFDYEVQPVLDELTRTGRIPDQKTHQFYPTPECLASTAVDLADIADTDTVLEPSAGLGGLAEHLPKERTTCVEISNLHCKVLEAKGYITVCEDFLRWSPPMKFSKIVMNPPFSEGRDAAHVRHACSFLQEGGKLVAILPASRRNKTLVEGWNHEWSEVFDNRFEGTQVAVVILVLTR
ncbi:DUF4942 domain-containing protein [Noviherbaspirillum pedocola]|uniref:DUF4942 domain-containing protein n=1 Tax=Noviherbaspirillum pedocola TaxID=2801341 RepID=A0A934T2G5_9BURK|nr:DUF4942 domain-containing protein [Noviherbaspirillum pedocola]MBK4737894.1 DUF4942 domain-containing protein [Noviherbaspirillum pedocola]